MPNDPFAERDRRAGMLALVLPVYYLLTTIVFPLTLYIVVEEVPRGGSTRFARGLVATTLDSASICLASAVGIWLAWGRWRMGWHWVCALPLGIVAAWMAAQKFHDDAAAVFTVLQIAAIGVPLVLLRLRRGIVGRSHLARGGPMLIRQDDFQFRLIDYFAVMFFLAIVVLLLRSALLDFKWLDLNTFFFGSMHIVFGVGVVAVALMAAFDNKRSQWVNFLVQAFVWIAFGIIFAALVTGFAYYFHVTRPPPPSSFTISPIDFRLIFQHHFLWGIWGNAVAGVITWGAMRIVRWGGYEFVWWQASESGKL